VDININVKLWEYVLDVDSLKSASARTISAKQMNSKYFARSAMMIDFNKF